jgi:hypothetical protein
MRLLSLMWTYIYNMGFGVALQKKKSSPLRLNLFIMGYRRHGFIVPCQARIRFHKWDLLLIKACSRHGFRCDITKV